MHRKPPDGFRLPSPAERNLVEVLTSAEFSGRAEVLAQLQSYHVRVIDEEGSLEICTSCVRPALVRYRVCTELHGSDLDGVLIRVMLHVVDGFCREIEIYKVDRSPIQRMPEVWKSFVPGPEWCTKPSVG